MILELIRISGDKIKISLTKEDLKEYRITVEKMDYSEKQTKEIFRKLLSEAKNKTGFDAGKARVFIHIYQSSDGGCEIFVSKIATKKGLNIPIVYNTNGKLIKIDVKHENLVLTIEKSKQEIIDLITAKAKNYIHKDSIDFWMKNPNPLDIQQGNDLPDFEISRKVMLEKQQN